MICSNSEFNPPRLHQSRARRTKRIRLACILPQQFILSVVSLSWHAQLTLDKKGINTKIPSANRYCVGLRRGFRFSYFIGLYSYS